MADSGKKKDLKSKNVDFETALSILTGMSAAEIREAGIHEGENAKMFRRNFTAFMDPSKDGRIECVIMIETA